VLLQGLAVLLRNGGGQLIAMLPGCISNRSLMENLANGETANS